MKNKRLQNKHLSKASGGLDFGGAVNIKNAGDVSLHDSSSSTKLKSADVSNINNVNRSYKDTQIHLGLTDMVSNIANPSGAAAAAIGSAVGGVATAYFSKDD